MYLKLQPYQQTSMAFQDLMKLVSRVFSPYQIIEKVGTMAYRLALPFRSQIHVFHVSLLQKHLGTITPTSPNFYQLQMILPFFHNLKLS